MKVAIIGVSGLVGQTLLRIINQSSIPIEKLIGAASYSSLGDMITFRDQRQQTVMVSQALEAKPNLAIFTAKDSTSLCWAQDFIEAGATVIDNSSTWRMEANCPLIIPEVNQHILRKTDRLIANPNCSTIQMLVALAPLHAAYKLKRVVISTYQSVTGAGTAGVDQLISERTDYPPDAIAFPHPIDLNVIPHIDDFLDNGYTKEEMKLVNETRKILEVQDLAITATAVRVPVIGGHALSVNATFEKDFSLKTVIKILKNSPGIIVQNSGKRKQYPMPRLAKGRNEVFVGRIRRDESCPASLNMWIVADNLYKGAATNAWQIAEYLYQQHWL